MTTRFSLAELADMLHEPVERVRQAVDTLAAAGQLTAESFMFGGRNWRIAPTDVKRIQDWLGVHQPDTHGVHERRRVVRKRVLPPAGSGQTAGEP
ncbi:MAG: hypothetical protein K6T26_04410 [Alicyclobacillus sp.]|nr:hypothetical protein [Alicyclobacillus sp.]